MIWAALAAAIAVALGARKGPIQSFLVTWLDEWRKHLRKHVDDHERRAAAQAILDDQFEQLDAYFFAVDIQLRALYDVHRDYGATFDEYMPHIDDMLATFAELQHQQVAAFLELHATLTADEWGAIQRRVGKQLEQRQAKREKTADR